MKSLAEPPAPSSQPPELLLHFEPGGLARGQLRTAVISAFVQLIGLYFLANVQFEVKPRHDGRRFEIDARRVTPLIAPDIRDLTQREKQTKEVAKEFDVQSLKPRPEVKAPPAQPAVSPRPNPGVPAASLPDGPQLSASQRPMQLPPPGTGVSNQPPPPEPQIQPQEKPRLAFENVPGTGRSTGNVSGGPSTPKVNIPIPKTSIEETISQVAKHPGGGLIVGDDADLPTLGEALSRKAAPGKMGSSLELLSDPQGADFRSYLMRVLSAVRRNWFSVIPESARLGRAGKVVVQFIISRDGKVPKLVIAIPSGADPLDRAAVAGISASNPFPPLPPEFKGDQIRLQLSFVYNGRMQK